MYVEAEEKQNFDVLTKANPFKKQSRTKRKFFHENGTSESLLLTTFLFLLFCFKVVLIVQDVGL